MTKYLESSDFFPLDKHYNSKGHIKHAKAIEMKLLDIAPKICRKVNSK